MWKHYVFPDRKKKNVYNKCPKANPISTLLWKVSRKCLIFLMKWLHGTLIHYSDINIPQMMFGRFSNYKCERRYGRGLIPPSALVTSPQSTSYPKEIAQCIWLTCLCLWVARRRLRSLTRTERIFPKGSRGTFQFGLVRKKKLLIKASSLIFFY